MPRAFHTATRHYELTGIRDDDPYLAAVHGQFERKFQVVAKTLVRPDDVVLDVGANIGATSLILAELVPQGRVHAFEPGRDVFTILQGNLAHNGVTNVDPHQVALSEHTGEAIFLQDSAFGHLAATGPAEMLQRVRVSTIDEFVEAQGLQRLDFIKIDVEGFEPQVLRGAQQSLKRFRPIVYFELNCWCLMAHGRNDPLAFMAEVIRSFDFVYRVVPDAEPDRMLENMPLWKLNAGASLVHDNMVLFRCANDLVVSNNSDRMHAQAMSGLV